MDDLRSRLYSEISHTTLGPATPEYAESVCELVCAHAVTLAASYPRERLTWLRCADTARMTLRNRRVPWRQRISTMLAEFESAAADVKSYPQDSALSSQYALWISVKNLLGKVPDATGLVSELEKQLRAWIREIDVRPDLWDYHGGSVSEIRKEFSQALADVLSGDYENAAVRVHHGYDLAGVLEGVPTPEVVKSAGTQWSPILPVEEEDLNGSARTMLDSLLLRKPRIKRLIPGNTGATWVKASTPARYNPKHHGFEFGTEFQDLDTVTQDSVFSEAVGALVLDHVGVDTAVAAAHDLRIDPWDPQEWPFSSVGFENAVVECLGKTLLNQNHLRGYPKWLELSEILLGTYEQQLATATENE